MTKTVQARFDGKAFHPEEPMTIAPNTRVLLTIEAQNPVEMQPQALGENSDSTPVLGQPYSFLKYTMSLNLEGPADWSENVDEHLYGGSRTNDD